jgi:regulator of replication initiation timing
MNFFLKKSTQTLRKYFSIGTLKKKKKKKEEKKRKERKKERKKKIIIPYKVSTHTCLNQ